MTAGQGTTRLLTDPAQSARQSYCRVLLLSFEAADVQRPWGGPQLLLGLADVGLRVLVHRRNAGEVPRLEGGERDGQIVPLLEPGQAAEVGQALAFLLGHVIAVGQVRRGDRGEPAVAARFVPRDLLDRIPDVVVVADGVEGLS